MDIIILLYGVWSWIRCYNHGVVSCNIFFFTKSNNYSTVLIMQTMIVFNVT